MKEKIIFIVFGFVFMFLVGCTTNNLETTNTNNVKNELDSVENTPNESIIEKNNDTSKTEILTDINSSNIKQKEVAVEEKNKNESNFDENKGVLTDIINFGEGEKLYGEIKTHKISKTAEVEALFALNDTDEISEFMGEEVYLAPMMINAFCTMMNLAIFDPEELERREKELTDSFDSQTLDSNMLEQEKPEKDNDMWNYLEGYTVTKVSITFLDAEDKTQIAKYVLTGKDSIDCVAYREYDPEKSFFNAEIGVFNE